MTYLHSTVWMYKQIDYHFQTLPLNIKANSTAFLYKSESKIFKFKMQNGNTASPVQLERSYWLDFCIYMHPWAHIYTHRN